MNKLVAMMLGSAGTAALNLVALTLAASRVELPSLDVYFVYRDATESILRLLFVSQIGAICVAAAQAHRSSHPIRRALLVGGAGTAAALAVWTAGFPAFADHFLPAQSTVPITGFSVLEIAVAVFCLCTWLDAIATAVLVQQRNFFQNHVANFVGAAASCALMAIPATLTVEGMAVAFAVGKTATTLPKVAHSLRNVNLPDSVNPSCPRAFGILAMALPYTSSNVLLQFNKFAYLAGVAFLAPGAFAIFNIYRRYYTAAQNLITVNIFNLSASKLTDTAQAERETVHLINRHIISSLAIFACCSVVMLVCSTPQLQQKLPEFITSPYAPLLWSVTLLNCLPDGLNFMLSRQSMLQGDVQIDSRFNSAQAIANLVALYPSMRLFGIAGLAYATVMVCAAFCALRLWRLNRQFPSVKECTQRVAIYGALLFAATCASLALQPLAFCVLTTVVSLSALASACRKSRLTLPSQ